MKKEELEKELRENRFALQIVEFRSRVWAKTDLAFNRLEAEIQRALTADPAFLKRQVLALLAEAKARNETKSFSTLKKELRTTSTRLTRCLKALQKSKVVQRVMLKRFPRLSGYSLVDEQALKVAADYWIQDEVAKHELKQSLYLKTFLEEYKKLMADPVFAQQAKENIEILREEFANIPSSTVFLREEELINQNYAKAKEEEAFMMAKLFTDSNFAPAFFETKLKVLATQIFRLLFGDLWRYAFSVASTELKSVENLMEAAREETPLLLYSYATLKVIAETAQMVGLQPAKLFAECFKAAVKPPFPQKVRDLLAQVPTVK